MYHISHEKAFVLSRTTRHVAVIRSLHILLLASMVLTDYYSGNRFDFPPGCYELVLSVILGLDIPTIYRAIKKGKTITHENSQ